MHRILVEEKRWIGEARFLHALNYCMLLPGPEAQQLATYIGWLLHRTWGGVVAGTLVRAAGLRRDRDAEHDLRPVPGHAGDRDAVLRAEGSRARGRGRGGPAGRQAGAQEPGHGGARGAGLRRHLLPRRAVPADRPGCGHHRPGRRPAAAGPVLGLRPTRGGRRCRRLRAGRAARAHPALARPGRARGAAVGRPLGGPAAAARRHLRQPECVRPHGGVLLEDGRRHLRWGVRRARLCRPGGRGRLGLAAARRDAGRARHGRDHARAADHGPDVRGLPCRLSRRRRPGPAARQASSAPL